MDKGAKQVFRCAVAFITVSILAMSTGCGGGGGSGTSPDSPQPPPAQNSTFTQPAKAIASTEVSTELAADGSIHFNSSNVGISATTEIMPSNSSVVLSAATISGGPVAGISNVYTFLSDFYKVKAKGTSDSSGSVELVFKTDDPSARIMVFSELYFVNILDIEPANGQISVRVKAVPSDIATSDVSYLKEGDVRYALVKQKNAGKASDKLASKSVYAADPQPADCSYFGNCRKRTGKVQITWYDGLGLTASDIDKAVLFFENALEQYKNRGLSSAAINLNWDAPVIVHVTSVSEEPYYRVLLGGIVLAATDITGLKGNDPKTGGVILHELAHLLQGKKYFMTPAALSGSKTWWMETTADNMSYILEPSMVSVNANNYGTSENELGSRYATQYAPFQWPMGEFYFQSQLLRMNLCDDTLVCPLSEKDMLTALDDGSYPFNDSNRQNRLNNNIHDYSYYLLGLSPLTASLAAPPENIKNGFTVGDYVVGYSTTQPLQYVVNGSAPRVSKAGNTVNISTSIDQGGVYMLQINNNGTAPGSVDEAAGTRSDDIVKKSTIPLALTVNDGHAPVRYRIGNSSETSYKADAKKFVIQPISDTFGNIGFLRLAAIGLDSGSSFSAKVEPVDLTGDWVFDSITVTADNVISSDPEVKFDPVFLKQLTSSVAEKGSYTSNPNRDKYSYSGPTYEGGMTISTESDVASDKIVWDLNLSGTPATAKIAGKKIAEIMKPGDLLRRDNTGKIMLAGSAIPLLLGLVLPGHRRKVFLIVCALGSSLLMTTLTSCVGFKFNKLNINSKATITKLEYIGVDGDDSKPLWKMTGTAVSNVDIILETSASDPTTGETIPKIVTMSGPVSYSLVANVYKDGIIKAE